MSDITTSEQSLSELVGELQRELAFYFGQHHGTLGHQADAMSCMVNNCVRVRNLCLSTPRGSPED